MSYEYRDKSGGRERGLIFMAYNASIAEQYETIQRWLNGGNSTYVGSGHNDPLTGVCPRTGALDEVQRVFRFVEDGEVIRVAMPKPFVRLHWGAYAFVPSRSALRRLSRLTDAYQPLRELFETRGEAVLERLQRIGDPREEGKEWKRLLEDFDTKDPSERDISYDMWGAIRWYYGGYYGGSKKIDEVPNYGATIDLRRLPGLRKAVKPDEQQDLDGKGNAGGHPPPPLLGQTWEKPPFWADQPIVLCASYGKVMEVLGDWKRFTTEEQLRRIEPLGIPIYVTQQPSETTGTSNGAYKNPVFNNRFDYKAESADTNEILLGYDVEEGFKEGYRAGAWVLGTAQKVANDLPMAPSRYCGDDSDKPERFFELDVRRDYLLPALGALCHAWYGVYYEGIFQPGGWTWEPPGERSPPGARCPGDFLAPSRSTFYPRPSVVVEQFAEEQGKAIHRASLEFVAAQRKNGGPPGGPIARAMFSKIQNDEILARNLVGTMIGAIPPMDGNLRGILLEWFEERTLWRYQAKLHRALGGLLALANPRGAYEALFGPVSQAMCKRPAPDLLYRTALEKGVLVSRGHDPTTGAPCEVKTEIRERDMMIVSLVSAAQRSLTLDEWPDGDVSIVFGGTRTKPYQPEINTTGCPVHACPAQKLALGAITGILAALLDSGRIQPLAGSTIIRITDWTSFGEAMSSNSQEVAESQGVADGEAPQGAG
jgi:hypothetical protein